MSAGFQVDTRFREKFVKIILEVARRYDNHNITG
jgi:hypothetical protein